MIKHNKLNNLYNLADERKYKVVNCDLTKLNQKGMVLEVDNKKSILIDYNRIETTAEETVITAHEIGHAETDSLYKVNSSQEEINRSEYQATKWAVKNLIPFPEYLEALTNGIVEKWQLAEHFNVTEDFILKTHYIYQCQGLI